MAKGATPALVTLTGKYLKGVTVKAEDNSKLKIVDLMVNSSVSPEKLTFNVDTTAAGKGTSRLTLTHGPFETVVNIEVK